MASEGSIPVAGWGSHGAGLKCLGSTEAILTQWGLDLQTSEIPSNTEIQYY